MSDENISRYDSYATEEAQQETIDKTDASEQKESVNNTETAAAEAVDQTAADKRTEGVSWQGESYSGKPAQDASYSTYTQSDSDRTAGQAQQPGGAANNGWPGYYGQPYQAYGPYQGAFYGQPVMKKKSKGMPKILKTVLAAVLFGLIAAGAFTGATMTINRFYPLGVSGAGRKQRIASELRMEAGKQEDTMQDVMAIASTKMADKVDTSATDVSAVVEEVTPSIVQINVSVPTQSWFGTYMSEGAGSGIIIRKNDTELLIATNNHVIEGAASITITFADDSTANAVVKGTDPAADLAVVAVSLGDIKDETMGKIRIARLGDSDSVKVGQMAIAIGNALGYGQSTTVGYISAKDREVTTSDGKTMVLIQTDAAINPGNSGGALLNLKGEVIGINSIKYQDESVEGMGFAIPISRTVNILNELADREILKDEEKGYLGVTLKDVSEEVSKTYGWPVGVYVYEVQEGLAAEKAGILAGDFITGVNGVKVTNSEELRSNITAHRAGEEIAVTIQRLVEGEYVEMELKAVLGVNPAYITES